MAPSFASFCAAPSSGAPADPSGPAAPGSGLFGLEVSPAQAALVVVPVPFDATTSYGHGTSRAPAAIVAASHQVELYDPVFGRPYEHGIAMLPDDGVVAALNERGHQAVRAARQRPDDGAARHHVDDICGELNEWVHLRCLELLAAGKVVGTLGGDHASVYAAIIAHADHFADLSILHIDAHCDLRRAYEGFAFSHASVFYNVMMEPRLRVGEARRRDVQKLVQVGVRDLCEPEHELVTQSGGRIVAYFDHELAEREFRTEPWAHTARDIVGSLSQTVYVSFDIDGLDRAFCPHTGTPVPGGLQFRQAIALLREVVDSGRTIVGFDLNEVSPGPAGAEWDANVGARLLYKLAACALQGR